MKDKSLITIFLVAFFGVIVGATMSSPRARSASLLDDLLKRLVPSLEQPKTNTSTPSVVPYAPTVDYEEAVIRAVEKASPSVVSIVISKDLPVIERCPYNPFPNLPPGFNDFFGNDFGFSVPCDTGKTKRQEVGGGSGFLISSDGMILTNRHVVSDTNADYTVLTNDGKKYSAKVLARDSAQDLAVIKINAAGLTPVTLGDSDSIKLGQSAIAIGNALGEFRNTVSVGVVSGLYRSITASGPQGSEALQGLIQTDAAINPGNSGGPLLNLKGEVIGINTAVAQGAENIGFAIPINKAKRDIESVKQTGGIHISYLGVRYVMITEEIAKSQKLPADYGALVRGTADGPGVIPNSPADKAGIKAEDIITEVNGEKLSLDKPLAAVVQNYTVGDTITLKIRRGDKTLDLKVTLEERPKE